MAKNRKKDATLHIFTVIAILLCLGAAFGGYWLSASSDMYYDLEKIAKVEIDSEDDFVSLGESIYNNEVVLVDDIHITQSTFRIGTSERPFNGVFNGNGHTVYCDFDTVEDGTSLFDCIESEGVIQNTNFVFNDILVNGSTYAGLAEINYGTIKDCTITFDNFRITTGKGIFSPVVDINRGTITNVVVDCAFSTESSLPDEKLILIGPICTYNYGIIKNVISIPHYNGFECTDEFRILTGETVNIGISAICAVTLKSGTVSSSASLIKDGVYTSDKNSGLYISSKNQDIFNTNMVFDNLDFDNRIWTLSEANSSLKLIITR